MNRKNITTRPASTKPSVLRERSARVQNLQARTNLPQENHDKELKNRKQLKSQNKPAEDDDDKKQHVVKMKKISNAVAPLQTTTKIEGKRHGEELQTHTKLSDDIQDKEHKNLTKGKSQPLLTGGSDVTNLPKPKKKVVNIVAPFHGTTKMEDVSATRLTINDELQREPSIHPLDTNLNWVDNVGDSKRETDLDNVISAQRISSLTTRQHDNEKSTRQGILTEDNTNKITSRWFKKRFNESEYDPHEHRHPENPTTNWETLFNIVKCCTSTGILTTPKAFQSAGLFNGLFLSVIMITLITYSISTLIKCQYLLCKRLKIPLITYADTMMAALTVGPKCCRRIARYSSGFMECLIMLNQIGTCAAYVIFVANNVKKVCDQYMRRKISLQFYSLGLVIPFMVISSVRSMKTFATLSLLGNCAVVLSFVMLMFLIVDDLPDIHEREAVGSADNYPLFVSNVLFSFDSLSSIIVAENNMEDPKSFGGFFGVFNLSMILLTIVLITIGFFGYWKYGNEVDYILSLNLPIHSKLSQIVLIIYSAAVIVTFGIQEIVPARIFLRHVKPDAHRLTWEYFIRISFTLVAIVMAATLRYVKYMVPFFGALCGTTLKLACPAIIELCLKYSDHLGHGHWMVLTDIIIIISAFVAMLTGLIFSTLEFLRDVYFIH